MEKKAKIAAAISAAVINYIQTEEERFMMPGALPTGQSASGGVQAVTLPVFNIWGLSGRQAIMQTRNLMQMKAFSRSRQ